MSNLQSIARPVEIVREFPELRPYQLHSVEGTRAALRAGHKRLLLQLATGGGKTIVAAFMVAGALARGLRVLWVAHRLELIDQAAATFDRLGLRQYGIIRANDPRADISQPLQIASLQTLAARGIRVATNMVVIDEAHRACAESYIKHLFLAYEKALIIGLSATPTRADGKPLGDLFQHMVNGAPYSYLIKNGFLAEPLVYSVPPMADMSKVRTTGGDFNAGDLETALNTTSLVGDLVDEWRTKAEGRRTVCFAVSVAHSLAIVQQFRDAGVRAEHLDGRTKEPERKAILHRLRAGETTLVSNVGVLCEGWDMPECKCLILARPTKSLGLYMQMGGRILRPCGGMRPVIIDHGANVDRHGMPHADRLWSLDASPKRTSEAPTRTCPDCSAVIPLGSKVCPECGAEMPPSGEAGEPDQSQLLAGVKLVLRTAGDNLRKPWERHARHEDDPEALAADDERWAEEVSRLPTGSRFALGAR